MGQPRQPAGSPRGGEWTKGGGSGGGGSLPSKAAVKMKNAGGGSLTPEQTFEKAQVGQHIDAQLKSGRTISGEVQPVGRASGSMKIWEGNAATGWGEKYTISRSMLASARLSGG